MSTLITTILCVCLIWIPPSTRFQIFVNAQEGGEGEGGEFTSIPTSEPTTAKPTLSPTYEPTKDPTWEPTQIPTEDPTPKPTFNPTVEPTFLPSFEPTLPTNNPTLEPTMSPTYLDTTCKYVAQLEDDIDNLISPDKCLSWGIAVIVNNTGSFNYNISNSNITDCFDFGVNTTAYLNCTENLLNNNNTNSTTEEDNIEIIWTEGSSMYICDENDIDGYTVTLLEYDEADCMGNITVNMTIYDLDIIGNSTYYINCLGMDCTAAARIYEVDSCAEDYDSDYLYYNYYDQAVVTGLCGKSGINDTGFEYHCTSDSIIYDKYNNDDCSYLPSQSVSVNEGCVTGNMEYYEILECTNYISPTPQPTDDPSSEPTYVPTNIPSSGTPTTIPSAIPSSLPTTDPTNRPSNAPLSDFAEPETSEFEEPTTTDQDADIGVISINYHISLVITAVISCIILFKL